MYITVTSDTHNEHETLQIPECDVFIHCGDSTKHGTSEELLSFINWVGGLNAKRKIIIAGNHDVGFVNDERSLLLDVIDSLGIIYLENTEVIIDGVKFFGSPFIRRSHNSNAAFRYPTKQEMKSNWALIPSDTDVLITHMPPFGVLDENKGGEGVGCEHLSDSITRVSPRLHVFGHIHDSYGQKIVDQTMCMNASFCNGRHMQNDSYLEFMI